jgi:Mg-chelatase subunit ChlI
VEVPADPAGRADLREAPRAYLGFSALRYYPFTAIVGQERLKRALLAGAVNPAVGGLLLQGPSGTGKSTAVRALAELLPEIEVVADCPWSCEPANPCGSCHKRRELGEMLPAVRRPVRIVDLPLNATEDRIAGTIDIARALREGARALEPGLLAEANRGLLYVDEINLLDDHLADVLLDAAALGVNVVEREGISVSHPARFLLVGTMNPEEGELRPQLADRMGLKVEVEPLVAVSARAEIIRRREAFTADPERFAESFAPEQEQLEARLRAVISDVERVTVPERLYEAIAALVLRMGTMSHRADVTVLQCAKALAALDGRATVETGDVVDAGELALGHRLPVDPFAPAPELTRDALERALEDVLASDLEGKAARRAGGPAARPTSS